MTKAHQKVASTLQIIVFDPFHRRATLTACKGGVSSSDPGPAGTDATCIVLSDEIEGGRGRFGFVEIVSVSAMAHDNRVPAKETQFFYRW